AAARRADQHDVGLFKLNAVVVVFLQQALVVVVNGNAEDLLGLILADDVVIQSGLQVSRRGQRGESQPPGRASGLAFLRDKNAVAKRDALVADVRAGRAGDQAFDLAAGLSAEAATLDFADTVGIIHLGHAGSMPCLRSAFAAHANK